MKIEDIGDENRKSGFPVNFLDKGDEKSLAIIIHAITDKFNLKEQGYIFKRVIASVFEAYPGEGD